MHMMTLGRALKCRDAHVLQRLGRLCQDFNGPVRWTDNG